jgi:cell division protein FtsB
MLLNRGGDLMKKERNYQPVMLILVLVVIGIFLWILLKDRTENRLESARHQENTELKQRADELARRVTDLEAELQQVRTETPEQEKAEEIFGRPAVEDAAKAKPAEGEEIERRVMAFFTYLDGRDYVKAYQLDGGTYAEYLRAVEALSASPPKVAGETESLYEMLRNVSYFFRVLGKKRVLLVRDVLANEREVLEPAMQVFFAWYTGPSDKLNGKPSLQTMYAYASYLQDTFGGRSYLLRRDSKIRLLATYYSILALDMANDRKMNPNGVDIRPLIAAAAGDIRSHTGLAYQRQYLAELNRIAKKYPM